MVYLVSIIGRLYEKYKQKRLYKILYKTWFKSNIKGVDDVVESMSVTETQINMYMDEFKVNRYDAIQAIEEFYDKFEDEMRDTEQDVINSTH